MRYHKRKEKGKKKKQKKETKKSLTRGVCGRWGQSLFWGRWWLGGERKIVVPAIEMFRSWMGEGMIIG